MLTILLSIFFSLMTVSTLFVLFACIGAARASRWEEVADAKQRMRTESIHQNVHPFVENTHQDTRPNPIPTTTSKYLYKDAPTVIDESDTSLTFNDLIAN
ncbi:MAG: hypothetical protein KDE51_15305 [Anaerolineales bacterium]|nr:hypothetical protein [Anaerolineales bacterium]